MAAGQGKRLSALLLKNRAIAQPLISIPEGFYGVFSGGMLDNAGHLATLASHAIFFNGSNALCHTSLLSGMQDAE
jgi:hypothetical protein